MVGSHDGVANELNAILGPAWEKTGIFIAHSFNHFDDALYVGLVVVEAFVILVFSVLLDEAANELEEDVGECEFGQHFVVDELS